MSIKKVSLYSGLFICILLIGFGIFSYFRSLPPIESSAILKSSSLDNNQEVVWGKYGSQAIGLVGYGVNNQTGSQVPSPVASTIKVLLTLSVLSKKPLALNQQGPNITITAADVASYNSDVALGESVVKVQAGEVISEYQALQALLIASANNFADILANWAFGSSIAYQTYANQYAKNLGMNATTVSDNSGFLTSTVSNANNLEILGQKAITNPVIASIVDQYDATIPVAGKIQNYNLNLSPALKTQINGIKTGNTTSGGGNYIYSSDYKGYIVVGSIVDAPTLIDALNEAPTILSSYESLIKIDSVATKGQVVGYYNLPWANKILVYTNNDITVPVEPNTNYTVKTTLDKYRIGQTSSVGLITVSSKNTIVTYPLTAQKTYSAPSLWWRIHYSFKKLF
jgi:serine-type D-Ala-D-Ala carboxypeptidase (penicillin-binding protein 5/6)